MNAPDPVSSLRELEPEQVETAMGVWRERMRAHAERRVRARDRERGPRGRRLAAPHPRPALRAARSCPPRSPASASASPPTRTAPRAATCWRTCSRRRCAGASGWWRWTPRPWRSARSRSRVPFHVQVVPRRPAARFEDDGPARRALLHEVLGRLGAVLGRRCRRSTCGCAPRRAAPSASAGGSTCCRAWRSWRAWSWAPACT